MTTLVSPEHRDLLDIELFYKAMNDQTALYLIGRIRELESTGGRIESDICEIVGQMSTVKKSIGALDIELDYLDPDDKEELKILEAFKDVISSFEKLEELTDNITEWE